MIEKGDYILGLDVSTKTIGIALFEHDGDSGDLKLLHHVSPKVKPRPESKIEELSAKADVFRDEWLIKQKDLGIKKVVIEEPLLRSNNVFTVATLLRFNGMIARDVIQTLGVIPEFISSYDARKYAFPELMEIRTHNKKGEPYSESQLKRKKPVLFGGYPYGVDKKQVIFDKVDELEPQIDWLYRSFKTKPNAVKRFKKENYDMADAYTCVRAVMKRDEIWK